MKVDITQLLTIFDKILTPPTDEELGVYWFEATRADGLIVTLLFSIYECYASVLIGNDADVGIASIRMKNCSEIKVLDEEKKSLEIIHNSFLGRCFLQLTGDSILNYDEQI
jgi:predicted small integral membrane protein